MPGAFAKVSATASDRLRASALAVVPGLEHERHHGGGDEQQHDDHLQDEDLAGDRTHTARRAAARPSAPAAPEAMPLVPLVRVPRLLRPVLLGLVHRGVVPVSLAGIPLLAGALMAALIPPVGHGPGQGDP